MHVMIMGTGALGAFYGARLQASGVRVSFIARGAQLEALQTRGLQILSPMGDLHLPEVAAFENPADAGAADMVLFMVKNYDVEAAGAQMAPVLGADTCVITAQNGVTAHHRLAEMIGTHRVAPGMVYMPADVVEPGVIRHSSGFSRIVLGPLLDGGRGPVDRIAGALGKAGIDATIVEESEPALWEKFALLAPMAALTATTRLSLGPIRRCPETAGLLRGAVEETAAVGRAVCPGLDDGVAARVWDFIQSLGDEVHASMLDDLTRGKRLELADINGEIVRLGRIHNIPTPINGFAATLLKPFQDGTPQ